MQSFKVQRESFATRLAVVSKAVGSRSPIPILDNILLESFDGELTLKATNLEMSILCKENYDTENFSTTVPAKLLRELIAILPDEEIDLEYDGNSTLKVLGKKSKNNIRCLDAEDFPPFPKFPESMIKMPSVEFKTLMKLALFAASEEEHRPSLLGVHFQATNGDLHIHSADGIQATSNLCKIECKDFETIVPAKALSSIVDLFDTVKMAFDDKNAYFCDDQTKVIIATFSEKFPDIDQILWKTESPTATFLSQELARGCKQALLFASGDYNPITLNFKDGLCEISSTSQEIGDGLIEVPGKINAEIEVDLNAKKVIDFLSAVGDNAVEIYVKNATSPVIFKVPNYENYVWVVMPIHI